jgi:hypothetical protein
MEPSRSPLDGDPDDPWRDSRVSYFGIVPVKPLRMRLNGISEYRARDDGPKHNLAAWTMSCGSGATPERRMVGILNVAPWPSEGEPLARLGKRRLVSPVVVSFSFPNEINGFPRA